MRLELKHIAPYLPHQLQILTPNCEGHLSILKGLKSNKFDQLCIRDSDDKWWINSSVKPILRPLSDLTKEIQTIHGEVFIPYKDIENQFNIEGLNNNLYYLVKREDDGNVFISLIENYQIIQILFQWHFDIFGLIENGLAIDINTLKS